MAVKKDRLGGKLFRDLQQWRGPAISQNGKADNSKKIVLTCAITMRYLRFCEKGECQKHEDICGAIGVRCRTGDPFHYDPDSMLCPSPDSSKFF